MRIDALREDERSPAWEKYETYRSMMKKDGNGNMDSLLAADGTQESPDTKRVNDTGECKTCESRKYKDGSDDPGVSFKTPTKISPDKAASAVRGHEMEHVVRERSEAVRENRKVISQSVTYQNAICPECGRVYVSGGTTRTTTQSKPENVQQKYAEEDVFTRKGFESYA